jgi:hypothetical protein
MAQSSRVLPSKREVLTSNPNTAQKMMVMMSIIIMKHECGRGMVSWGINGRGKSEGKDNRVRRIEVSYTQFIYMKTAI